MYNLAKKATLFFMITLISSAQEGLPLSLQFYDAGVPQWLDRENILEGLKSKGSTTEKDPLVEKLIAYSDKQDLTKAELKETSFDLEQRIHEASFINKKSFNCKNAAKKLNKIEALKGGGKVVLLRGSRRVLIAHVGVKSFCIQASAFDGSRLNDSNLQELYDRLFNDYINEKLDEGYVE